jgi:hypothetical protein
VSRAKVDKFDFSVDGARVYAEYSPDRIARLPLEKRLKLCRTLVTAIFGDLSCAADSKATPAQQPDVLGCEEQ